MYQFLHISILDSLASSLSSIWILAVGTVWNSSSCCKLGNAEWPLSSWYWRVNIMNLEVGQRNDGILRCIKYYSGRRCRISMGPRQPKMFASSSDDGMDSAAVLAASSFASFGFFEWGRYNLSVRCLWQVFHVLPLVVWALSFAQCLMLMHTAPFWAKCCLYTLYCCISCALHYAFCALLHSEEIEYINIKRSLHRLSFATRLMQTPCSALLVW